MTRYNDTMKCIVCDTVFEAKSPKAKFCSEACKQRNKRNKSDGEGSPTVSPPKEVQESPKKLDTPLEEVLPKSEWFNAFTPYEPVLDVYQPENGDVICNGDLLKGAYPAGTGTNLLAQRYLQHFRYHKNSCNPVSKHG